jgi:cation diffusion facilitator family transporter
LWIVLVLNVAVTVVKLVVGLTTGALSIVADGFHSLIDSSSNVIGLAGVWIASRPPDRNHPYGHQKYETIAAMAIGVLLTLAAYEIGQGVIDRLVVGGAPPQVDATTVIVMAVTFAVNLGIVWYETREGKRLKSQILLADAAHTRVDLFVTLSVMAALSGALLGWPWLDPLVAAGVVVLLVRASFGILRSASETLTDVAVLDPAKVRAVAESVAGVVTVSGVRSRGRADAAYVDLRIGVDPGMGTAQAHGVASEVERRLSADLPGVVEALVHVEPQEVAASGWMALAYRLRSLADGSGLGLHDLNAHAEPNGALTLEAHVEVDARLTVGQAHALVDRFEARVRQDLPEVGMIVTHIEPVVETVPDEAGHIARSGEWRRKITVVADQLAGDGATHAVELHHVGGGLTASLHVTQPADLSIVRAHDLAERIELSLHQAHPALKRVVVHVEPP